MSELATIPNQTAAIQQAELADRSTLLRAVALGNMSAESAKAAVELYKDLKAMDAKQEFARAFSKLQASFPRTIAQRVIKGNAGEIRSTFASFDDIMQDIAPHLADNGFSVSFDAEVDDKRITACCILTHVSGHSQTCKFAVRLSAPPGTSSAQADGSTMSYAKRYAMCNMLNISISHDTDARMEGDYITDEQANSLKARVAATKSDVTKFLKLAAAPDFAAIRTGKYAMLDAILLKKEKQSAPTGCGAGMGADATALPEKADAPKAMIPESAPTNIPHQPAAPTAGPTNGGAAGTQPRAATSGVVKCPQCAMPLAGGRCPACNPPKSGRPKAGASAPVSSPTTTAAQGPINEPAPAPADMIDPPALDEAAMATDEEQADMYAASDLAKLRNDLLANRVRGGRIQQWTLKALQVAAVVDIKTDPEEKIRHAARAFKLRALESQ